MMPSVKVQFSWRYGVIGVYRDREEPIWRFYIPFVRLSIGEQVTGDEFPVGAGACIKVVEALGHDRSDKEWT